MRDLKDTDRERYICVVKQWKNNPSSCRSNPGLVKGARGSESGGVWMDMGHMGNWKLPAPLQISFKVLSYERLRARKGT